MLRGRRPKYDGPILLLRDHEVYTPGMIAALAKEHGMLPRVRPTDPYHLAPKTSRTPEETMRATLWRFARNRNFPKEGDTKIFVSGQGQVCAWFGWRWKEAVRGPLLELADDITLDALVRTAATYRLREVARFIPMDYDDLLKVMIHELPEEHGMRYDPTADEVVVSMLLFGPWLEERLGRTRPRKNRPSKKSAPLHTSKKPQPVPDPYPGFGPDDSKSE